MTGPRVEGELVSAEAARELGGVLGRALQAGDLVLLSGPLGAGKTTVAQGIGAGLGVRGPVTSPTFVIARVHPSTIGGPPMVHVDAYRVGDRLEVDDLDLDASVDDSVTVVEWGDGKVEGLAVDRLVVTLGRADAAGDADVRTVAVEGLGARWSGGLPAGLDRAVRAARSGA